MPFLPEFICWPALRSERRSGRPSRGERVRPAERHLGAARSQRDHQGGGLGHQGSLPAWPSPRTAPATWSYVRCALYSFGDTPYFGNLIDHGYPGPLSPLVRRHRDPERSAGLV